MGEVATKVLELLLDDGSAIADTRRYFASYTGRHFESLDGGGDRPAVADRFTAADLVAVQMLSVTVPAEVSADLLVGQLGRLLTDRLRDIPLSVQCGDPAADALLESDGPADLAWRDLVAQPGVGWVTAGKLLARKRPHLVPVYDNVVRCVFGSPPSFWTVMQSAMADAGLRTTLDSVRVNAGRPGVSLIRVLDVAIWMSHHEDHRAMTTCAADVPDESEGFQEP